MSNVNIKENNNIVAKNKKLWLKYKEKNPAIAQFLVFFATILLFSFIFTLLILCLLNYFRC